MAFVRKQDTGGGDLFKFDNVGDSITGVYLGFNEAQGDFGPYNRYLFKTDTGTKMVRGSTHINELLQNEATGQLMRLTYTGLKPTKKGKPMKKFELDIDDSYSASESELESARAASDNYDDESGDDEEEITTGQVKPAVNAGAPSAAARSKVDSLLKNNRRAS